MADKQQKIRISDSASEAANYYQQNPANGTPSADSAPRRSPVTDLLFDTPRADNQRADSTKPAESQRAVYHISIVAEMVETHPQTLRMYERMGLLNPQRTRHNVRLYSEDDVEQVRRIQHLTQDLGVNLAGVEVVFKLLRELHQLREELEQEIESALHQQDEK